MAVSANATLLNDLINPQVMADVIEEKLVDAMKFAPLCMIDTTLQGRAGNTVTLPSFGYIGDAADLPEGETVDIEKMTTSTKEVTVKKIAKGAELTDEAVLSGYGDPVGQLTKQLTTATASKIDNDVLATMATATLKHTATGKISANGIADAKVLFGEDIDGVDYLFVAPQQLADLRKGDWLPASDVSAELKITGTVGMVEGSIVVVSNKIKAVGGKFKNYIMRSDAIAIFLKRNFELNTEYDILNFSTVFTTSQHYTTYLYDESKIIEVTFDA